MSGGRKPPKKVEAPQPDSAFKGINRTSFGSAFGSGTAAKNPVMGANGKPVKGQYSLDTQTQLADFLQPVPQMAGEGIQGNLGFLQRTPQQQFDDAVGGNNALYNLLQEQTRRSTDSALGRSLVDSQGLGTRNSTTAGAAQGTILNDSLQRQNSNLLQAIQFGNDQGRANLGANLNTLGSLANLTYPLGSAANANLLQGFGARDSMAQSNAALQFQANQANTAAQNQYDEWKRQNGLNGTLSQLFPVYGFASGNTDLGMKGLTQAAQIAGAAMGMGGGMGGMGGGGGMMPTGGFNMQQGLYQPKFETSLF